MYKVIYSNGMVQFLELVSQMEYTSMKDCMSLTPELITERFRYLYMLFKEGKGFTDNSPIYCALTNGGNVILPHGTFKCEVKQAKKNEK